MSFLPSQRRRFTPQEYLTIERASSFRSEYLHGEIYAMAGASPAHTTIVNNLMGEVYARLKGTPCQGMALDMKVTLGNEALFAYPDFLIVCGEAQFLDAEQDVLTNPVVLIEVLSPSTEKYDRTTKFDLYKNIPTLREYVLIAQDAPCVERFVRGENGEWEQRLVTGLEGSFTLESVSITLALRDLYDRLTFSAG
jgi:Uma2 family endonuclease